MLRLIKHARRVVVFERDKLGLCYFCETRHMHSILALLEGVRAISFRYLLIYASMLQAAGATPLHDTVGVEKLEASAECLLFVLLGPIGPK